MNKKRTIIILIVCIVLVALTFVFPEHYFTKNPKRVNIDAYFRDNDSLTEHYQIKVREILRSSTPGDFRYYFITFTGANKSYMMVNMRNDTLCFDAKLLVTKWDKLTGMKRTNGVSYPKELYDLTWELSQVSGIEEILFKDMHKIID